MKEYICDKCNKTFGRKSSYSNHINKKFPCTADTGVICPVCKKKFRHASSMYSHKRQCCYDKRSDSVMNTIHNTVNANIQNNKLKVDGDVKVVKFGDENLSYISDDLYKHILGRGFGAVGAFIEHSHFNNQHPENHNIYIANIKDEYIVIYDGDKWTINRRDDMMEDIIYAKSDFLYRKFKELVGQMNQGDIERFLKFMSLRDDDQTMNRLKEEVKLQLYNNRKLPQFIRKRMEQLERIEFKKLTDIGAKNTAKLDKIMNMLEEFDDDKLDKMERLLNSINS